MIKYVAAAVVALASTSALAADFKLNLSAANGSRWYDYFSDAYGEVGKIGPGGAPNDAFFLISNDDPIGGGLVLFKDGGALGDLGQVSYSSGTGSGIESQPITALNIEFGTAIADGAALLGSYTTSVQSVAGTVDLFNGQVTGLNLLAAITFTYSTAGLGGSDDLPYAGTFAISGGGFGLDVDATNTVDSPFGQLELRYRWDVDGAVNGLAPIPEPSTYALLLAGLGAVSLAARRRKPA